MGEELGLSAGRGALAQPAASNPHRRTPAVPLISERRLGRAARRDLSVARPGPWQSRAAARDSDPHSRSGQHVKAPECRICILDARGPMPRSPLGHLGERSNQQAERTLGDPLISAHAEPSSLWSRHIRDGTLGTRSNAPVGRWTMPSRIRQRSTSTRHRQTQGYYGSWMHAAAVAAKRDAHRFCFRARAGAYACSFFDRHAFVVSAVGEGRRVVARGSCTAVVLTGVERLAGERRGGAAALAAPGLSALVERERADAERDGGIGPPQAEGGVEH